MEIDRPLIDKLAGLARLEVTDAEADELVAELGAILGYLEEIGEVDTAGLEPLSHPFPRGNVLREDEPRPSLPRDKVLENAPESAAGAFRVPRVL